MTGRTIRVGVAYATPQRQLWLELDVPEGTTAAEAIALSGILEEFPEIDLETQKIGQFNKPIKPGAVLEDGARVEIYRPITADPMTVKRTRPEPGDAG